MSRPARIFAPDRMSGIISRLSRGFAPLALWDSRLACLPRGPEARSLAGSNHTRSHMEIARSSGTCLGFIRKVGQSAATRRSHPRATCERPAGQAGKSLKSPLPALDCNQEVAGSSPARGANYYADFAAGPLMRFRPLRTSQVMRVPRGLSARSRTEIDLPDGCVQRK
jgi:hypothetical protein